MSVIENIRPQAKADLRQEQMLINGSWVDSLSGVTLTVENPAKRTSIATIPRGDAADVAGAVEAAARAFPAWSKVAPRDRGRLLLRIADKMEAEAEEIARTIALETGNALRTQARGEARLAADIFRYFGGLAGELKGDDPVGRSGAELHPARTAGRRRRNHPVECSGAAGRAKDRARLVRGQHTGVEGRGRRAAWRLDDGRDLPGISAARRAQRPNRARRGMRRTPRAAPGGAQAILHRFDRGRQDHHACRCRAHRAGIAGVGRQEP